MFRMFWGDWMPSAFGFDAWDHRTGKEDRYHNTATVSQMSAKLSNAKAEPKGKRQNERRAEGERRERFRREEILHGNGRRGYLVNGTHEGIVVFDYKRAKSKEDLPVCVLLLRWGFRYSETYCFKPKAHLLATMQTLYLCSTTTSFSLAVA